MAGFISKIKKTILLFLTIFLLSVFDSSDAFAKICDGGVNCTGKTQTLCEEVAGCTWVVNPDLTDESSLTIAMCNVVTMATGTGAKVFASLVIISLGIGFFTGKISWGLILGVGGGIASIFGSVTIVAVISGSDVLNCVVGVKADCTSTSEGYDLPENSSPKSSTSANNNSSIKILCNSGFFGHINDLVCFDGIWYGASGFCEQTDCGDPNVSDPLDNGTWDVNQANDGETITGTCDNGFRGPVTIQCSENNFINMQGACDPLPVCDSTTQGYQDISEWGEWSADSAYIGQSVSASCYDSDLGVAPSDMECVYTEDETAGIWQGGDNENCKVFQPCNDASTFMDLSPNGSWLSESVNHGDSIDGNCSYGNYDLPPELVCNDGSWESIGGDACPSQCIDADVNFDISLNGGTWPSQTVNYESTITANCPQQRSTYDEKPELTCGDEGIFTFNEVYCHEGCIVEAGSEYELDPADGSWSNGGIANSGDEITAICATSSTDLPVLSCHDGEWTHNGFICYASCSDPNGFLSITDGSWESEIVNHGATVKATCTSSSDVPTLECNDGYWIDLGGVVCNAGCTNADGFLSLTDGSWNIQTANHGATIQGSCNSSSDIPTLECNDGTWSNPDNIVCHAGCSDADSVVDLSGSGGSWPTQSTDHGGFIIADCLEYTAIDPRLDCDDGTFIYNNEICFDSRCHDPEGAKSLANGGGWTGTSSGDSYTNQHATYSDGTVMTGSCLSAFNTATPTLTCNEGTWIFNNDDCDPVPDCVAMGNPAWSPELYVTSEVPGGCNEMRPGSYCRCCTDGRWHGSTGRHLTAASGYTVYLGTTYAWTNSYCISSTPGCTKHNNFSGSSSPACERKSVYD